MQLLIDDRWFGPTGIGRYIEEILIRKPNEVDISYLKESLAIKNPLSPLFIGRKINRAQPDLFWSPGFMPPAGTHYPFILTIHDLIHLRYAKKIHKLYFNTVVKPLIKSARYILTVSNFARQEIIEWSGLSEDKVISIYNGVSPLFSPQGEKYNPGFPYILYIGNRRIHKNLTRMLQAFAQADLPKDIRFALSGAITPEMEKLTKYYGIKDRVHYLGYIQEKDLPSIYRGALLFMFVSLYEGFGLPLLEAMACGTPVITSNITALPEIAEDAALIVDPFDIQAIVTSLEQLVDDVLLQTRLIESGFERIKYFSWDTTANQVWQVLLASH